MQVAQRTATPWYVGTRDLIVAVAVVVADDPVELVPIAVRAEELQLVRFLVDLVVVLPVGEEHPRVGVEVDHQAPRLLAIAGERAKREGVA